MDLTNQFVTYGGIILAIEGIDSFLVKKVAISFDVFTCGSYYIGCLRKIYVGV